MDEKLFSKLSIIFLGLVFLIYILMFSGIIKNVVAVVFGSFIAPLLLIASIILSIKVLQGHKNHLALHNHLALYPLVISAVILLMFFLSLIL